MYLASKHSEVGSDCKINGQNYVDLVHARFTDKQRYVHLVLVPLFICSRNLGKERCFLTYR